MREGEMGIPPLFQCPITLDLFTDPVTLCTGQTYDRSSIEKWLAAGNSTCPVTMQKLQDLSLVPNHTLRHLIEQWRQTHNHIVPDCLVMNDNDRSIIAFKHDLQSGKATLQERIRILETIQALCEKLPLQNSSLIQLDFFQLLLGLVFKNPVESLHLDQDFVEKALVCVVKLLPFSDLDVLNMLKEDSESATFVHLFKEGSIVIKESLCHLLGAISSGFETKELCAKLGQSDSIIQETIRLVCGDSGAVEAGIRALSALSLPVSNRENLVKKGAVQWLVSYIWDTNKSGKRLAPLAMATIELLVSVEAGKEAVLNHPFGVHSLVKMVFRVCDHAGSESALNSLLIVCSDSKKGREEAISVGVLTQLLLLLQSNSSSRTKAKARMLLKLLRKHAE